MDREERSEGLEEERREERQDEREREQERERDRADELRAEEGDRDWRSNPPRTTTGKVTSPKFGSATSGGGEFEPGPERD